MLQKISKSENLFKKLRDENKTELLNKEQHLTAAVTFSNFLDQVKADFNLKDKQSQISATKVILTA